MTKEDIRAFAGRDWALIEEQKATYWADRKATLSAGQALAIGEALRQKGRALRPDWPNAEERAEDLAVHIRVSAILKSVG